MRDERRNRFHHFIARRLVHAQRPAIGITNLLFAITRNELPEEKQILRHRLRLHLNANLRHLSNVTWRLDLSKPGIELGFTAMDGVRERFRMRLGDSETVWRVEQLLRDNLLPKPVAV